VSTPRRRYFRGAWLTEDELGDLLVERAGLDDDEPSGMTEDEAIERAEGRYLDHYFGTEA
jgi:hypothetical protein